MAARALTAAAAAARRVAAGPPLLASCRRSGAASHFSASVQREEQHDGGATMTTGEQVEAAQNCKNVEVLQGEEHVATVLPDEAIDLDLDVGAAAAEDVSWVPDQETGVFGPADADTDTAAVAVATHGAPGATMPTEGGSVLDQMVFVREEEMQDVERPAMDNASDSNSKF